MITCNLEIFCFHIFELFYRSLSSEHQITNVHENLHEPTLKSANSSNPNEEDMKGNLKSTKSRKNKSLGSSKKIEDDFEGNGSTKHEHKEDENSTVKKEQFCPKRRKNRYAGRMLNFKKTIQTNF